VAGALEARGIPLKVLELDEIRKVVTPEPTYSAAEREIVYRALAYMAKLLTEAGVPVLIDATADRRAWRDLARTLIPIFAEVQLLCPLEVYDVSPGAELTLNTDECDVWAQVQEVLYLARRLSRLATLHEIWITGR